MASVFDVLAADHAEVLRMLDELEPAVTSPATAAANQGSYRDMVEQLVIEESKHEAVEEMYFWPAVREHLELGDELATTGVNQEDEGKKILHVLDGKGPEDAEFAEKLRTFISAAREHIAYEQDTVWPRLREKLSTDQQDELGAKIADAKQTAPTRPHPHTPAKPGVLKTAGAAAAVTDRARDAMSDRGR